MLCGSHIKIRNVGNHMKKMKQRTSDSYTDRNNLADLQK